MSALHTTLNLKFRSALCPNNKPLLRGACPYIYRVAFIYENLLQLPPICKRHCHLHLLAIHQFFHQWFYPKNFLGKFFVILFHIIFFKIPNQPIRLSCSQPYFSVINDRKLYFLISTSHQVIPLLSNIHQQQICSLITLIIFVSFLNSFTSSSTFQDFTSLLSNSILNMSTSPILIVSYQSRV